MSSAIRTVVLGVGAVEGDTVLPAGVDLAKRLAAELHVVHSYEIPHPVQAAYVRLGMRESAVHRLFSERLRVRLEAEVHRLGGDLRTTIHAVGKDPGVAICDAASEQDADLIVLGATRLGGLQKHILGSTADRVIRGARVPVLVLRPPFTSSFRRVMITTDLTPASAAVVRHGLGLVNQLTSGDPPELRCVLAAFYDAALPQPIPRERLIESARGELERFLSRCCGEETHVKPVIRIGDPAREVVADAASSHADLVVLGTHGRTGVSRYFLGSVAGSVLRSITTSALVIPHAAVEETVTAATAEPATRTESLES
jgi:nucleotide-binding universal stress UspA family protein